MVLKLALNLVVWNLVMVIQVNIILRFVCLIRKYEGYNDEVIKIIEKSGCPVSCLKTIKGEDDILCKDQKDDFGGI